MKVGDMVHCNGVHRGGGRLFGIILLVAADGPFGMQVYTVLDSKGNVENYTSAAVRKFYWIGDESR